MREPELKMKQVHSPHLFYILLQTVPKGDEGHKNYFIMSEEMKKAVDTFCHLQPNYDDLHSPLDYSRLFKIIYLSVVNKEDIPWKEIKEKLPLDTPRAMNSGTLEGFICSCKEYVAKRKEVLQEAESYGYLIKKSDLK